MYDFSWCDDFARAKNFAASKEINEIVIDMVETYMYEVFFFGF